MSEPSSSTNLGGEMERERGSLEVLFVTRKWPPAMGGMETWAKNLAEQLAEQTSLDLVALPGRSNGMPPSALSLLMFPFTVLIERLKFRGKPDLILIGDMAIWPLALLFWPLAARTRLLIAAHGTDASYHRRGGFKGSAYGLYLRLGAKLLGRATVIANSHATAEALKETGWTNSPVIPLATKHEDQPTQRSNTVTRQRILFAGRLLKLKGCGWFVREVLPNLSPDIALAVAGTGWDPAEQFVLKHPRVEYLGQLDQGELRKAYADALCVIVPNIDLPSGEYEGFGLVAVEAAAAGGIVLASDHGGLRDAVIDGKTGRLIPSGDAEAWITAINAVVELSEEERSVLIDQARTSARDYFNWNRVTDDVLALVGNRP